LYNANAIAEDGPTLTDVARELRMAFGAVRLDIAPVRHRNAHGPPQDATPGKTTNSTAAIAYGIATCLHFSLLA
jgi:hypothetical protein